MKQLILYKEVDVKEERMIMIPATGFLGIACCIAISCTVGNSIQLLKYKN